MKPKLIGGNKNNVLFIQDTSLYPRKSHTVCTKLHREGKCLYIAFLILILNSLYKARFGLDVGQRLWPTTSNKFLVYGLD